MIKGRRGRDRKEQLRSRRMCRVAWREGELYARVWGEDPGVGLLTGRGLPQALSWVTGTWSEDP